ISEVGGSDYGSFSPSEGFLLDQAGARHMSL
ncbi:hypothetical protein A2U01_0115819, partial [Trifolium medium]|nr:hypothetical protein [Trifolium medium]